MLLNTHKGTSVIELQQDTVGFSVWPATIPATKHIAGISDDYFLASANSVACFHQHKRIDIAISLVPEYERIIALPDSNYLFCIENGFAILGLNSHTRLHQKHTAPAPVIRWAESPDGPVDLSALPVNVAYRQNTLHFHFAIPSYGRPPNFSWILEGFTQEWSPWQSAPWQSFINLPAGKYNFRVKTDQNDLETSCIFTISPPWYLSGIAWVLYAMGILMVFAGIELMNRRRILRHKIKIEEENEKEMERQRLAAEHEKLAFEVDNKTRELSNAAFNLIRKNETLQHLKDTLQTNSNDPNIKHKINRMIDEHLEGDHDWEVFEEAFNRVHDNFFIRLMRDYPDMTQGDLRLAAYLRMNLSTKEIAPLLNMSLRGVENKRYRLRKKLGLPETENLAEFLINF